MYAMAFQSFPHDLWHMVRARAVVWLRAKVSVRVFPSMACPGQLLAFVDNNRYLED